MVIGIYGAGGTGKAVCDYITAAEKIRKTCDKLVFIDDVLKEKECHGLETYTFEDAKKIYKRDEIKFMIALGDPALREKIYQKITEEGFKLSTYIHPMAEVSSSAVIGDGSCIAPNSHIDSNVVIERNVMVYPQAIIGHDTLIKAHSFISIRTFIGGHSLIEEKVYYGPCAVCKDRVHVGEGAVIGPNATLFRDVPSNYIAIGNPAKSIPKSNNKIF